MRAALLRRRRRARRRDEVNREGRPEVDGSSLGRKLKTGRHAANDRKGTVVEIERVLQNAGIRTEVLGPEAMAQDDGESPRSPAGPILLWQEHASECWLDAEQ